jgi:hypothetical protein
MVQQSFDLFFGRCLCNLLRDCRAGAAPLDHDFVSLAQPSSVFALGRPYRVFDAQYSFCVQRQACEPNDEAVVASFPLKLPTVDNLPFFAAWKSNSSLVFKIVAAVSFVADPCREHSNPKKRRQLNCLSHRRFTSDVAEYLDLFNDTESAGTIGRLIDRAAF